jgi:hypothetical protein
MRRPALFAPLASLRVFLPALALAAAAPFAFAACDQDYASSTAGRETFMGATREIPRGSASAPTTPPMAPPQMGAPPAPIPQPMPAFAADASTDAAPKPNAGGKPAPAAH